MDTVTDRCAHIGSLLGFTKQIHVTKMEHLTIFVLLVPFM